VSGHRAAVILGTLNGTAPTLGLSIAGGQSRNSHAVDENSLSVIAGGIIKLIWGKVSFDSAILGISILTYSAWSPCLQHWQWKSHPGRAFGWSLKICQFLSITSDTNVINLPLVESSV
jgi:hypothetical protein